MPESVAGDTGRGVPAIPVVQDGGMEAEAMLAAAENGASASVHMLKGAVKAQRWRNSARMVSITLITKSPAFSKVDTMSM